MQWIDLLTQLSYYMQQEQPDTSFTAAVPNMVNNAELRIYRDLDFAAVSGQNTSLSATAQSRVIDLTPMVGQKVSDGSALAFPYPVVVQAIAARVGNVWTNLQLVSQEWLDNVWPDLTQTAAPIYYTMNDNQTAIVAPVPDLAYPLRITGTWRPAPMSASNPKTWLGDNAGDILFAATMLEAFAYQRDFSPTGDQPQAAMSWKTQYDDLKRAAMVEEALRHGQGPGYQPYPPPLMAGKPA